MHSCDLVVHCGDLAVYSCDLAVYRHAEFDVVLFVGWLRQGMELPEVASSLDLQTSVY